MYVFVLLRIFYNTWNDIGERKIKKKKRCCCRSWQKTLAVYINTRTSPAGHTQTLGEKKRKKYGRNVLLNWIPREILPFLFFGCCCFLTLRLRLLLYFLASAWLFIVVCSAERKTRESIYISFYFLLRKHVGKKKKLFSFLSTLFLFFFFFYNIGDKNSHDSLDDGYNIWNPCFDIITRDCAISFYRSKGYRNYGLFFF